MKRVPRWPPFVKSCTRVQHSGVCLKFSLHKACFPSVRWVIGGNNNPFPFIPNHYSVKKMRLVLLLVIMGSHSVICDFQVTDCNNVWANYTELRAYIQNLKTLIDDLSKNVVEGFSRSSSGQSPYTVYGLFQCFGNASGTRCTFCLSQAYTVAQSECANDTGARVWTDSCFLGYDITNFSSRLNTTFEFSGNQNFFPEEFTPRTSSLLSHLSGEATNTNKYFAVGSDYIKPDTLNETGTVYGLVQCWRHISIKDCTTCLSQARKELENCCSGKQGARVLSTSCTARYETYPFYSPMVEFESSSLSSPHRKISREKPSKPVPYIVGFVAGMAVMLLTCSFAMRKTLKSAIFGGPVAQTAHNEERSLFQQEQHFDFSFEELAEATANFHKNKKLGEGGFGAVYKGRTKDGKEIAVKKLSAKSTQGNKQFMNEVKLVANVQHRNLVKLMGCCAERDERLIVYEYLPNKSLDNFLFEPEKFRLLDWQKRYNMIVGIARGLLYLHEDSPMKIIHRDIKPSNVLLDEKLDPKIADFGLARLFPEHETHIQTSVAGTWGYMAPEYVIKRKLSVKADIYSFGVLLLEILSGKKNMDMIRISQGAETVVERAWELYNEGNMLDMMDSEVLEGCPEEQVSRFIHIGLLCVQDNAALRPPISIVILMLSSSSMPLPIPTEPGFLTSSKSSVASKLSSVSGSGMYEKSTASQTSVTTRSSSSGVHINEPKMISETNQGCA